MTDTPETFDNFIHMSVDVVQAATDIIEEIGGLKMLRRSRNYEHHPRDMLDLRKAISKAARALANYDAATAAGITNTTRAQFEGAAKAVSQ